MADHPASSYGTKGSPHSSDDASHHGTPSTNLTAFSPEGGVSNVVEARPLPGLTIDVASRDVKGKGKATEIGNDPFTVVPTPTNARSYLSPTAESFTPQQLLVPSTSVKTSQPSTSDGHAAFDRVPMVNGHATLDEEPVEYFGVSPLLATSVAESATAHRKQQPNVGAIGDPVSSLVSSFGLLSFNPNRPITIKDIPFLDAKIKEGVFSTDEGFARAFMIVNIDISTPFTAIAAEYNVQAFPSLKGMWSAELGLNGSIYLSFCDIRDAIQAFDMTRRSHPEWNIFTLTARDYAKKATHNYLDESTSPSLVSNFEGQIILSIYAPDHKNPLMAAPVFGMLKSVLSTFGTVKAFHTFTARLNPPRELRDFRIEFHDTRAASNAIASLKHILLDVVVVDSVGAYKPDVGVHRQIISANHAPPIPMRPSATRRSAVPIAAANDPHYAFFRELVDSNCPPPPGRRFRDGLRETGASHNQVDINRIQNGQDVRTTGEIMLRNIPNKIDQGMLKQILDLTSHGCYDFMYLRIDFANNCNVGYAFINFVDALAIIPFALARAGQRWNKYNSDKVAEISYATIQGKDCLVQKFRNSSVMLEHPTFRPKLFTTSNGPNAGDEEPFPGPDNASKMRRSVENAEHVGLFPYPRSSKPRSFTVREPAPAYQAHPAPAIPSGLLSGNCLFPAGSSASSSVNSASLNDPFHGLNLQQALAKARLLMPNASAEEIVAELSDPTGLFAPRQGQVYREEQRRRRSNYDRGTSAAEYEAFRQTLRDPALDTQQPRRGGQFNINNVNSLRFAQMAASNVDIGYNDDY